MFKKKLFYLLVLTISCYNLFGQESYTNNLKITIQQADSIFAVNNLALLAEKCNVDGAKAQIIQARLFTNPTIVLNQNVYNTEYKTNGGMEWLDYSDKGETSAQIQKLFRLAGKRNKQIKIAEASANKEEQYYFDLLRTLKFSLRSGFYNIYYLDQILKVYEKEIASLGKMIEAFQSQYEKGFISKKELLRLKSTQFSLENEKLDFTTQLISSLSDFNVLMHTSNVNYLPQPDAEAFEYFMPEKLKLQALIDTANASRFDLKMARSDLQINKYNYAYQKSLAVPDMTLTAGWDRNGSFIHNYNFIGLQIDLPFFNRNQGNIKSADFGMQSSKFKLQDTENQVKSDVVSAYAQAVENDRLYRQFDKKFIDDLEELNKEMLKNYEKKNIGLVEFLDYYDAYKSNAVQLNNLQYNRINSFENINYSIGKEIIPIK